PLIDAKGTAARLVAVASEGYYQLEVSIKNQVHTMLVPVAHAALYFTEPEPIVGEDTGFEIER
ncbi:MAG: hypothetical protein K8R59_02040, partial [Thermoanaerobaculales bacterium]|nr:hypothetical protein [Thermoanaerobaculales bacterium]